MNYYFGLMLSVLFLSNFSHGGSLEKIASRVSRIPRLGEGRFNIEFPCGRAIANQFIKSSFTVRPNRYTDIYASGAAVPIYHGFGSFSVGDQTWPGFVGSVAFGNSQSSRVAVIIRPSDVLLLPSGDTFALDSDATLADLQFVDRDQKLIYRQDGVPKLFDIGSRRIEGFADEIPSAVMTLSGSINGKFYAFFYAARDSFIYNPSRKRKTVLARPDFANEVTFARFTHDSSKVIGIAPHGTLNVWRTLDGKLIHRLRSRRGQVVGFELSADCRFAALTYSDGYLEVRELNNMRLHAYANLEGVYGALQFRGRTIVARRAVNDGIQTLTVNLSEDPHENPF